MIKSVINRARDWDDFNGNNPASKVKRSPNNASRTRYLNSEEIRLFLENCDTRLKPLIICALLTGMRRGEILGIKWDDIDWGQSLIFLPKTKSGQPRWIPLSPLLRDLLSRLPRDSERVFPLCMITFRRLFDRARNASGLPPFRFHDLRRTFATHYHSKTYDLDNTRRILGHSTLLMTQRYLGFQAERLRVGLDKMDALIQQTSREDLNARISPQPALTGDILPQENAIVPSQGYASGLSK